MAITGMLENNVQTIFRRLVLKTLTQPNRPTGLLGLRDPRRQELAIRSYRRPRVKVDPLVHRCSIRQPKLRFDLPGTWRGVSARTPSSFDGQQVSGPSDLRGGNFDGQARESTGLPLSPGGRREADLPSSSGGRREADLPLSPGGRREADLPSSSGGRGGADLPKTEYISSIERRKRRVARLAFAALLLLAAGGTAYAGRNWESTEEEKKHPEAPSGWGLKLFFNRVRARVWDTREYYTEPAFPKLLPDPDPTLARPFTLVIGLEDLLVHNEWSREHGWRVAKRPGVDYFLRYLQQYYELVIFTTTPMAMAEAVIRKLDPYRIVLWPLFREATKYVDGHQVKDLSYLNRDLSKVIMIETDPSCAELQPENTIMLPKWNGDPKDRELVALIPFLEYVATMGLTDARDVLKSFEGKHIPTEFAAREAIARRKFEEQMSRERSHRPSRLGKGLLDTVMGGRAGAGLDPMEQSAAEAFEQGKMLQDYIRERGQKQYEALEKEIQENGEKWLKEMAAEEERMTAEQMDGMKSSVVDFFGGFLRRSPPSSSSSSSEKDK